MTNSVQFARWLPVAQTMLLRVSLVLFVVTLGLAAYKSRFLRHARRTQGTVVRLEEVPVADSSGGMPSLLYSPVFQYQVGGTLHTAHANTGSNPPVFATGQSVEVLYFENEPQRAQLLALSKRWGFAEAFGIATLVTGLAGIAIRWARGSKNVWEYIPSEK